ncbi:MAG: hypothetical protein WKG07_32345 [Hymenobacter sp.]
MRRALLDLPQKEKDQLLTRLVAQDAVLTEQLAYRLLEGPEALENRRAALRQQVDDPVRGFHQTPNDLLVILRQPQARLAYHTRLTDDAFGEVELSLRLLANVLRHQVGAAWRGCTALPSRCFSTWYAAPRKPCGKPKSCIPTTTWSWPKPPSAVLVGLFTSGAAPLAREAGLPASWG